MGEDGGKGQDLWLCDRLFELLFSQPYAVDKAGALAQRLREVADGLEAQSAADPAPAPKRKGGCSDGRERIASLSGYQQRHVALELMYVGWAYHGFASQDNTPETIEGKLFAALRKTRLIDAAATWQSLGYSRCGRTDKGVSALGQVVALRLRSLGRTGGEAPPPEAEMDYARVLNRALPGDIRVLGWCPVPSSFSARFSALRREYKYLFVQDGRLDLGAMAAGGAHLLGTHDFRNFCKIDAEHVASFDRTVLDFRLEPVSAAGCNGRGGAGALYAMHVAGTAFLWHQVRCIAAVLLMVGRGLEAPGVVAALLDVAAVAAKPQYTLAPEAPLILYACHFEGLRFRRNAQSHGATRGVLQERIERDTLNLGLLGVMAEVLNLQAAEAKGTIKPEARKHMPLLARGREPPLAARLLKARPAESSYGNGAGVDKGPRSQGNGTSMDVAPAVGPAQGNGASVDRAAVAMAL